MVERSVMALRGRQDRRIVFDYWPHTQKEKKQVPLADTPLLKAATGSTLRNEQLDGSLTVSETSLHG